MRWYNKTIIFHITDGQSHNPFIGDAINKLCYTTNSLAGFLRYASLFLGNFATLWAICGNMQEKAIRKHPKIIAQDFPERSIAIITFFTLFSIYKLSKRTFTLPTSLHFILIIGALSNFNNIES